MCPDVADGRWTRCGWPAEHPPDDFQVVCVRSLAGRRDATAARARAAAASLRTAPTTGAAHRARTDRHDVRLRHHPLRRHPPSAAPPPTWLRPGPPGVLTAATGCTTCRTSPTSTTRCSSGPPATASTGDLGAQETQLFREDADRPAGLPPQDCRCHRGYRRGGRDGGRCWPRRGVRRRGRRVSRRVLPRADATTVNSAASRATAPDTMMRLFAERAAADPDRPGKADRKSTLVLWRAARPGRPSWPSPFGLADRAGMSDAPRSR